MKPLSCDKGSQLLFKIKRRMTPFGKKYLNMSLFNIILVLWLLQTVATKRNFQNFGITSHFDALLNQIPDKSVSINIIYDETDPVQRVEAGTLANLIEVIANFMSLF